LGVDVDAAQVGSRVVGVVVEIRPLERRTGSFFCP